MYNTMADELVDQDFIRFSQNHFLFDQKWQQYFQIQIQFGMMMWLRMN